MATNEAVELRNLMVEMRKAYHENRNVMAIARSLCLESQLPQNTTAATLIAYDLQSGSYVQNAREHPDLNVRWCQQLSEVLRPYVSSNCTVLEVGCGEATTLSGVLKLLTPKIDQAYGFDISWSRINVAQEWLKENQSSARLFVGDLFSIPMADNSVDIVYSSHSLEPNGGREHAAIQECLRVAKRMVILIEPLFELASPEAQDRMKYHGYVKGLREAAESLGATIDRFELLPYCSNPLNPSGVLVLEKTFHQELKVNASSQFRCPLTGAPLKDLGDVYYAEEVGVAYPVLRNVPLLRAEHAVVASLLNQANSGAT